MPSPRARGRILARRVSRGRSVARNLVFGGIAILSSAKAEAHFKINTPMSWMSQDMTGFPQKAGPCSAVPNLGLGDKPGTPTKMVTVFQPGQTMSISVTATIAHTGWWRVALAEGASSTQTLTTLPEPDPKSCTPAIMGNPVWSPTQPILADGLPTGSVASTNQKGTITLQVKLPETANCTNSSPCTLQVIMVMTDHTAPDCYYHHCADIVLGSATDGGMSPVPDASVGNDAAVSGGGGRDGGGAGGSASSGGSSGSGGITSTGGISGSGGFIGSGGSPGSGGELASSGGARPNVTTGGSPGTTLGSGGSGTGGSEAPGQSGSGSASGCSVAGGGASWILNPAGLIALALIRRRRPRR